MRKVQQKMSYCFRSMAGAFIYPVLVKITAFRRPDLSMLLTIIAVVGLKR